MAIRVCKQCGLEVHDAPERCPQCGGLSFLTIEQQVDSMLGRTVAGRYRIERQLGKGGMGSVYAAQQVGVGNTVAVKFLNEEYSRDQALARRFLHEARTYIRIAHPNAVMLHDFGQDTDGRLYIAMEYVEGQSLAQLLTERGRLPLVDAVDICLKVAEVLGHAHGMGVVHRDLKPENVMVRPSLSGFHVKVLDFGVAHLSHEGVSKLTNQGAVAGTPRAMAPEQIRSEGVDQRTDVYALGLLFFEMLTGRPAFDAVEVATLMMMQITDPTPKLGTVDPQLSSPEVDAVIARATAKDPARRYPTMVAFADALGGLVGRQPTASTAPTRPERVALDVAGPGTDPTFVARPPRPMATPNPMPPPVVAVPAPRGRRIGVVLVPLLLIAAVGSAFTLAWFSNQLRNKVLQEPKATVTPPVSKCPGLEMYDEKYSSLSVAELEKRTLELPYMLPSAAKTQLATLQASAESWAPGQRDCMYRASLAALVANAPALMKTQPSLWGHTKKSDQLKTLFLEMPNIKGWSVEHRAGVIRFIEKNIIPALKSESPADTEWWRQMYYGLQLTCFSTDEALQQMGAMRSKDCAEFPPEQG